MITEAEVRDAYEALLASYVEVTEQFGTLQQQLGAQMALHQRMTALAKAMLPEEEVYRRLAGVLAKLAEYGDYSSLNIFKDGSLTVDTRDGDKFWKILETYPNIVALLSSDLAEWPGVAEVGRAWRHFGPTEKKNGQFPEPSMRYFVIRVKVEAYGEAFFETTAHSVPVAGSVGAAVEQHLQAWHGAEGYVGEDGKWRYYDSEFVLTLLGYDVISRDDYDVMARFLKSRG
ncbi:MAG: hypothetical protein FOGNACKC_00828 [Anaerolineae bacterium]|nr:hypothetical protein [Anaerolineae bacterium]